MNVVFWGHSPYMRPADVALTLATGRSAFEPRGAVVGDNREARRNGVAHRGSRRASSSSSGVTSQSTHAETSLAKWIEVTASPGRNRLSCRM